MKEDIPMEGKINNASPYDQSFLRRNGISVRFPFKIGKKLKLQIDLMVLVSGRLPKDAASSFDLTCCEVWYDPKLDVVEGTHIELTISKKAFLRKEYNIAYTRNNPFTRRRLNKYVSRGFSLTFEEIPPIVRNVRKKRVLLVNYETFYVMKMLDELFILLTEFGTTSTHKCHCEQLRTFLVLKNALLFDNVEVFYRPSLDGFIKLTGRIEEIINVKNLGTSRLCLKNAYHL